MKKSLLFIGLFFWFGSQAQPAGASGASGAAALRWAFAGAHGIDWKVGAGDAHTDHIEMSGMKLSAIITYGVDKQGLLVLRRKLVFPMLRTIPNNTRGSLVRSFDDNIVNAIRVGGVLLEERPASFYIDGFLASSAVTNSAISVERVLYPSADKTAYIEKYTLTNSGGVGLDVQIPRQDRNDTTDASKGVDGAYIINYKVYDGGAVLLAPGAGYSFYVVITARKAVDAPFYISADYESEKRKRLVDKLGDQLILHTPNDTVNRMFAFAKVRATESIFDTKGGLMHGPGGGDYYAAIWANDQAEYMGPLFPFIGNAAGNESARNCYRLFASYMNPEYKPIPSSIIAEGAGVWNGAGDRGDQAMIAYGASRFALAYGDSAEARRLWPLIDWCLEYLRRKKTEAGVIASRSDELEGRFPAGKVNLSTNALAYGAMVSAGNLARSLGRSAAADSLVAEAARLRTAIEAYFGSMVQGYDTYRYYEGNTTLRSWICLPLVMGIFDRKEATIRALLSDKLWTANGILTESGSKTFWDRATLYAFRGLFYAGVTDITLSYFDYYSARRLLGEHVPYAVEAWPEGDQRHLSAESGLYCRAVTEGLFGIEPVGLHAFTMRPGLPAGWNEMALEHIRAFNSDFDIRVLREGAGERVRVLVAGATVFDEVWDGGAPLRVDLAGPRAAVSGGMGFRSSDGAMQQAFEWAKEMALHYKGAPGDPVGPWYESALPPRSAFCMRDVSHQCIGGELLGLSAANKNMLTKFVQNISEGRDWCSYWEMDKWDRPAPADYRNDKEFWYNLNANFDVLHACWRMYLWTGDTTYIRGAPFVHFMERSVQDYIGRWELQADSLLTRPTHPNHPVPFDAEDAFHRCRGLPSYSEGVPNIKMGVDLVGAIYRGLLSYADWLELRGKKGLAAVYRQKAARYQASIDKNWWDKTASLYHTYYTNDGKFGKGEGETFLLWFDALKDSVRERKTIEHLLSMDLNVENLSYLPLQFYRRGYVTQGRQYVLHLADAATARREYPEVSFGVVEAIVQGVMGVDANAATDVVSTLYQGLDGTNAELVHVPVLGGSVGIRHDNSKSSVFQNEGDKAIRWRACFKGHFEHARVGGRVVPMKTQAGVSFVEVLVPAREGVRVGVF
jgi:hypothetical protein